jgi:hypothetical protein
MIDSLVEWIKMHPTELGLILTTISIAAGFIVGSFSAVQYVIIRKAEMFQKRFENYHQLINWITSGRGQGDVKLDDQITCIYELKNFKTYKEVSIRILEGLKIDWSDCNPPADKRLLNEVDITLNKLRGKIMKRPASLAIGILLLFLACAQLCRYILKVEVIAAGMEIPLWPSAIAAVVLAALGIWLLKERSR